MKKDWTYKKLGEVCFKDFSSLKQKELNETGKYPVYGASGIVGYLDTYQQENPYIAIVKDGSSIGRVSFQEAKSSVIGTMQYIIPKEGYNIMDVLQIKLLLINKLFA